MPLQAAENQIPERELPPYILNVQQDCTLEIQTDVSRKTAGTELLVYRVGKIDATSLSLSFVLNEEFEESKADLIATGNTERRQAIETLYEYVLDKKINPFQTVVLDEAGKARICVPQGAYLICQKEDDEMQIQATLVGVPCVSESLNEWQYSMKVQLKVGLASVPTGDTQNSMLYAALAIAAFLLLAALMLVRKHRKK